MAVDVADTCDALHAAYTALMTQLASLPVAGSVSDQGRTISASSAEIESRMALIEKRAAALGCPIGTLGEPFCIVSGGLGVR